MGSHFQAPPSTVHIRSIFPHWKVGKPEQLFPDPIMLQLCMFNFFFLLLMLCFTIHHSIAVELEHAIILMYSALGLMNVNWHVSSPLAISFYPRLHASKCKSLYVYIDMYLYVYIQTYMVYAANQSFCMLASFFYGFLWGLGDSHPLAHIYTNWDSGKSATHLNGFAFIMQIRTLLVANIYLLIINT